MSNHTLSIIVDILRELAYTVILLAAAVVAYLALQRPKVKQWLRPAGRLVQVVVFLALTVLIEWPFGYIVSDLFAFLAALVGQEPVVYPGVRCFGGVLTLVTLTVGIVLLARGSGAEREEE
jgi:hypothetical protein